MAKMTPRTLSGFMELLPQPQQQMERMMDILRRTYSLYGFTPLDTPVIEASEVLLAKGGGETEKQIYRFTKGDSDLALRFDLTVPLAKYVAANYGQLTFPFRRYQIGKVWRGERAQRGRFREFYQADIDIIGDGALDILNEAEIPAIIYDTFTRLGLHRFRIRVNNRKVLNGVMEVAGVLDPADPEKHAEERGIVLRAIDKFDKFGEAGVRALMGPGRLDESGDFTKGAGLSERQADVVMGFMAAKRASGAATCARLRELVTGSSLGAEGVAELETIAALLASQGYGPDRIVIDPSVVRGLGYYTGPVFEAELTFEILDEKGRKRQFGSVAGGGRYDDLVKRFTGQEVPATGVSIGVDRLLAALRAKGRLADRPQGPVVVTVMDRDRMGDYLAMASTLRAAGIRAEVYLGNPKNFGNQLKYADKRQSPVAIIQGADEAARGVVQIKDLILGARIAASASVEEWKAQPAQFEVSTGEMVAKVQEVLARYGVT